MRIDSLHLQSFRGFDALDLGFHPSFSLLLGENGAGKTAVLEALSVALGALFHGLLGTTVRPLTRDDVRHRLYEHAGQLDLQPQWPVVVSAKGALASKPLTWTRTLNLVAMVADIAWRSSVLNPYLGEAAAVASEGVILIDEIDLHLHPRWQRHVLDDLRRTFPRLQFVATTHSPQIIASAHREEVRMLANNVLVPLQPFVEGRDTNSRT
jgi:predicted ATP-binding protein involved in virulence